MERIAYVGNDRQLYLADPPGRPRRITDGDPGRGYAWPTWAPDGRGLAVMRHARGARLADAAVEWWAIDEPSPLVLWSAADGGPVFIHWSPDGTRLALLIQEANDLHLVVADRDGVLPPRRLATGAPLYWGWCRDSSGLVAHVGGDHRQNPDAEVVWLSTATSQVSTMRLSARPVGFRAPACSPAAEQVVFAAVVPESGPRLLLHDLASGEARELEAVGDDPAFVWSPVGDRLAFSPRRRSNGQYETVTVLDVQTGRQTPYQVDAVTFLWTPDGRALLCAATDASGEGLAWTIVDLDGGAPRTVARFSPTDDLALLLGHFDQYAPAVRLCARDEAVLLYADAGHDGRHNGHSTDHADLWLADTNEVTTPRHLAGGTIGFFGPAST